MNAEVIAIGDELTSGQRLDTNSQWLSGQLGQLGIRVLFHTTVGDDLAAGVRVLREAFDRADVIVCTGGLGPTTDDLTRHAIVQATETELVLDDEVLQRIRALFRQRQREMPASNIIQAHFPKGSRVIVNPHGTAPGIDMDITRPHRTAARLFALPGIPAEMREMWEQTVRPALEVLQDQHSNVIRHKRIKCFGVGESDLEQLLPDLIQRGRHPSVGITVSRATITLRITAEGPSEQACYAAMEPTITTIHQCLGNLVFGDDDDELHDVVLRQLAKRNQTLSIIEWGTGGLVSNWLGKVDGSGKTFLGGIVARKSAVTKLLHVDAMSRLSVQAQRCREWFGSDFALAVGSLPEIETLSSSLDEFQCALAGPAGVQTHPFSLAGHPEILRARCAKQSLNLLRLSLLQS